jgi:hypothetical protein
MKTIRLTKGFVTLVDNEDYERWGKLKWYVQRNQHTYYAARKNADGHTFLHKKILGIAGDVDHKNGVGLDNRRENLRLSDHSKNGANCLHGDNSSGFKGVIAIPRNKTNPWKAEIRHRGRRFHLGYFPTAEAARDAYQAKALEIYGEFARFERPVLDPVLRHLQGDHNADAGKPRPNHEGAEP